MEFTYFVLGLLTLISLWVGSCVGDPSAKDRKSPIVETTIGKIQGLRLTYKGQTYDEFKGIPFAKPPIKNLRFERPQPAAAWDGVLATTHFSLGCTQIVRENCTEDCLYLNVYVPAGVGNVKSLPVMAYAHGGGFISGGGDRYDSKELAITGQVIVVTYNYRLSTLGGLATRDASSPGNYMLWDARAAHIWIRDNIAKFGGDPSRVTAFGQSAGSVVVSHLAISPMTKGLLQRAILLSGNTVSTIGVQYDSRQNAKNLASFEDCPTYNTRALVHCLRQKDAKDIDVSGLASLVLEGGMLPGWLPAVDGVMVPKAPRDMWNGGAGSHVDLLVGSTHHDAAGFVYVNIRGEPRNETINLAGDKELLPQLMALLFQSYAKGDPLDLVKVISDRYPDLKDDDVEKRSKAMTQIGTDFIFAAPAHFEAMAHSRNTKGTNKKTFLFDFKYRPSFVRYTAPWITGSHSDDLYFVFGEPFRKDLRENVLQGEFTKDDNKVKTGMMSYLSNFAYTGDPNKGPHKAPTKWPEYSEDSKHYLEINPDMEVKKETKEHLSRYDFWLNHWPTITKPFIP